jgi:hypothetical protein
LACPRRGKVKSPATILIKEGKPIVSVLQIHLLFTHAPLFGVAFGAFAHAYGVLRRNSRACEVAYAIYVVSGILAGAAFLTGWLAEDAAKKLPGVSETLVDAHQEAALGALIVTTLLGVVSGLTLAVRRFRLIEWTGSLIGVLAVAAFILLGNAANLGGQIRHPEVHANAHHQQQAKLSLTNTQVEGK